MMAVIADCARMLGRTGHWDAAIALCESLPVPDPDVLLARAEIMVERELFGGHPGAREALEAARPLHGSSPYWKLAYARHRYTRLVESAERDPHEVTGVVSAFAELATTADAGVAAWARFHDGLAREVLHQDNDGARLRYADALAAAEALADPLLTSYCLRHLAVHQRQSGDTITGRAFAFRCLALRLGCGAMPLVAAQLIQIAEFLLGDLDHEGAGRAAEQAAAIARDIGMADRFGAAAHQLLTEARSPESPNVAAEAASREWPVGEALA
jgi:hypothetical protein